MFASLNCATRSATGAPRTSVVARVDNALICFFIWVSANRRVLVLNLSIDVVQPPELMAIELYRQYSCAMAVPCTRTRSSDKSQSQKKMSAKKSTRVRAPINFGRSIDAVTHPGGDGF